MHPLSLLCLLLAAPPLLAAEPAVSITLPDAGDAIELRFGLDVAARYVYRGTVRAEKGDDRQPLAKPYFYPLIAPNGVAVTRDWPLVRGKAGETTDHFHQKSAWFCHGDIIPEGLTWTPKSADKHVTGVDFWSETRGHGVIRCDKVEKPTQHDGDHASVRTLNTWLTPDGQAMLSEVRTLHLEALPHGRLIRLDIELKADVCPVTFGDTKEGSLGVRVPDGFALSQKGSTGVVTSSDGTVAKAPAKDNLAVWGKPADWHDYSGAAGEKAAGLAVFDHPANAHRAAWHTRAYGLMAANPFAREASGFPGRKGDRERVRLAKGETLTLRYALHLHDGDAAKGEVAKAFAAFAQMR